MLLIERQKAMLLEVYKCIHELGLGYRHVMISQKSRAHNYRDPSMLTLQAAWYIHSKYLVFGYLMSYPGNLMHVNHMHSRATPRLYYLRQLRRCGLSQCDLLAYYRTLIRPILECACPVWHGGLTKGESDILEKIQKLALKIIYSDIPYELSYLCDRIFIPYEACIQKAQIEFLKTRRGRLSKHFLLQICQSNHRLTALLVK